MAKTEMQRANRAWRKVTKSYGWDKGWKGGKKEWKAFCRENAFVTVENADPSELATAVDAEDSVMTEISYWD